jgi:hypothetical protein
METHNTRPNQDLDETYHPSSGNLIPEGNFEGYKDSVDQDGPEKVQRDFTPGGDSGSDKHAGRNPFTKALEDQARREDDGAADRRRQQWLQEHGAGDIASGQGFGEGAPVKRDKEAAMLVADIYTDFARSNGMRVASLDTLDRYAATGIHDADYRLLQSMIIRAAEDCSEECDDDEDTESEDSDSETDSEAPKASESDDSDSDDGEGDDYDFGGEDAAEDDSDDESESDEDSEDSESDDEDYDFGGDTDEDGDHDDADHHGGETFTVPEHAPELDPQLMGEIPQDDASGSAPVPPEVIDSLLGLPEGTIEQLLLEEVEQGQGGDPGMSGPPAPPQGGGDDFFGGGGDDTEQEPPRVAARRRQAKDYGRKCSECKSNNTDYSPSTNDYDCYDCGATFKPYSNSKKSPEKESRRRQAGGAGSYYDQMEQADQPPLPKRKEKSDAVRRLEWMNSQTQGPRTGEDIGGGNLFGYDGENRHNAARSFWAAEGEQESEGGDGGGEQQAAPAQDPAAMGGQPMMPPPGSQAVAPPAPAMPLENQPAEDALLDTANQAIMQMIDRETQEYQQIIDPLSQALQAIQFAQQVEQSEHPMDVTPPEGTVNVDPSAAPGGAQNPMQQQAMRRRRQAGSYDDGVDALSRDMGRRLIDEPAGRHFPTSGEVSWPDDLSHHLRGDPSRSGYDAGFDASWHPSFSGHEDPWEAAGTAWTNAGGRGSGFDDGWVDSASDIPHRYNDPQGYQEHRSHQARRRQAKVEFGIRNAAKLIASRYRLSATGHQMLLNAALGRRGYEHVVEALKLVPLEVRKAAAIHMSHLFAAGNDRFNKDVFLKTVLASNPRDRAGDAWRDGRDRGIAEHGRHDMDDRDEAPLSRREQDIRMTMELFPDRPKQIPQRLRDLGSHNASRGRLPFDRPRLAGETWMHTPTMDAFEFPNAGEVPRVDDNNDHNNLPKMEGAEPHRKGGASQKAVDRFQRWQKSQQQRGLATTEGEAGVHNFLQTRNPIRKRVGPDAQNMIHEHLGLQPDAVKTPKAKPVKAVNPTLKGNGGKTPAAPKAKAPAPKAAPKTASFFTRKVPGWRWDDHLSGYLAKEAKTFTCSCGQKIASPSYKTCSCGKIWNVYAIGDSHHLASDTAEVYIAREIPVRDNVIMANKKLAGAKVPDIRDHVHEIDETGIPYWLDDKDKRKYAQAFLELGDHDRFAGVLSEYAYDKLTDANLSGDDQAADEWYPRSCMTEDYHKLVRQHLNGGHTAARKTAKDGGCTCWEGYERVPNTEPCASGSCRKKSSRLYRENLAAIERLADWTKYDSPDPTRDPKAKPPSTTIKSQPGDWTNRDFTGPTKGQWREPEPTELPRKTRKKK